MIIHGIDTNDISVIVQGAVHSVNTKLCLNSIRKYLPGAEIILSTWKDTDVSGLKYDTVLFNDDPGAVMDRKAGWHNNMNRQIVSTIGGLKASRRKYCLKLRSDLVIKSRSFLRYFCKFPKRNEKYTFFKERVVFLSSYFKKHLGEVSYGITPSPYHISDWLMFGLREDIAMLFNIDIAKEPQNTHYLVDKGIQTIKPIIFGSSEQYAAEQYIFFNSLKKHYKKGIIRNFKDVTNYCGDDMECYEKLVANNCIILEPYQFSIYCAKKDGVEPYYSWTTNYLSVPYGLFEGLYRHDIFLADYKKYCDNSYRIPKSVDFRVKAYLKLNRLFVKG